MTKQKKKVFVAMSGGVDSSVAALLLKRQGYQIVGVFMHCFNVDGCAIRDAEDARQVAEKLKIPFYVWNFRKEYKKKVVDYMVRGYRTGITPNPDVMCNKEIKFGLFLDRALKSGADYIATGHYVKIQNQNNKLKSKNIFKLFQAKDKNKDQSYFLWTLTQEQLKYCLFPIGDYLKSEVRQIAKKAGLITASKKDSQGICFLGKVSLGDFLKQYIPEKRGAILGTNGKKLGEHKGVYFYTIGQRHGLAISGKKPYYIIKKDVKSNTIIVVEGDSNPKLYRKRIELTNINFINQQTVAKKEQRVLARVRYRQPLSRATLIYDKLLISNCHLIFDTPQKFIAPGQSVVFYSNSGEMFGGGIIN